MSHKTKPSILVVDDELSIRESFSLILEEKYNVLLAASGESALKKIVDEKVDVIYLDIRMPGMDGMEALKRMMKIDKALTIIMVTAVNDVQKATEAVKLGAKDYVVKPFNVDDILNMTENILKKKVLTKEAREIRSTGELLKGFEIIGKSKVIAHVIKLIEKSAKDDSGVIIYGERGVENELVAASIHRKSKRSSKPFKILDITKNEENILRVALFGSGKGSSSETLQKEKGLLEETNEGMVLLRNIEKLPMSIQKELATAIKKKEILRVGSDIPISIDIRIIGTTTADLKELINLNLFSRELYNTIGETYIDIPPLRERSEDLPEILNYYLEYFTQIYNKAVSGFSQDALDILSSYPFPGNTEELKSLVKHLILKSKGEYITLKDIPLDIMIKSPIYSQSEESKELSFETIYNDLEKSFIERLLMKTNNNVQKTAKILGLNLSAFQAKLGSLGIKVSN